MIDESSLSAKDQSFILENISNITSEDAQQDDDNPLALSDDDDSEESKLIIVLFYEWKIKLIFLRI